MARIKYIDAQGEHTGTLTLAEYHIYAFNADLKPTDTISYMSWDDTDYEPFNRAVGRKYNTEVIRAWLVSR